MDTIRWGIIGVGDVTEVKSGPGFQNADNSSLVAVMRRDGRKAEDYARRHGVPHAYDDADALINDSEVDAVSIANSYARATTVRPRDPGHWIYPDSKSEWVMAFPEKDSYFLKDGARRMDGRLWMHYNAVCVTPAMALTRPGAGSDYQIVGLDAQGRPLDGAKTYRLHLSSMDWQHGFSLQPVNINVQVHPGYDLVMTIKPDQAGEYGVVCNEFCGIGHHNMVGKIYVTD